MKYLIETDYKKDDSWLPWVYGPSDKLACGLSMKINWSRTENWGD